MSYPEPPKITTTVKYGGGKVVTETDIFGQLTRHVIDVAAALTQEGIRSQLIALGWTPPKETGRG